MPKEPRKKAIVYRQDFDDGLGRKFSVAVPVIATEYWDDEEQEWIEALDSAACDAVDAEIERIYPGWFHTCHTYGKENCKACGRGRARQAG